MCIPRSPLHNYYIKLQYVNIRKLYIANSVAVPPVITFSEFRAS